MNSLEKIFNSIKTSNTWEMKLFSTKELIKQLREYDDYTLYVLKSIYGLLCSENTHNRVCGAKILHAMENFDYCFDFKLDSSSSTTEYVYLQFKEMQKEEETDVHKQKKEIKRMLSLDHVETEFLENQDITERTAIAEHKTAEYREKKIENVMDFFEAVSLIQLSPDWFKRHGGFIGYCAIIASKEGWDFDKDVVGKAEKKQEKSKEDKKKKITKIPITIGGDIFNRIYEILKNDKFNDFQDDVTSSPVKEAASVLLKYVYPMLNNRLILHEIAHLLTSEDWQEQFSAVLALWQLRAHFTQELVDGKGLLENIVDQLVTVLESADEDVRYVSAELLSDIVERFQVPAQKTGRMAELCWEIVEEDGELAHSKASVLMLLKAVYQRGIHCPPDTPTSLYPCFTSSTTLVKDSAIELSQIFDGEDILYVLAESILLEQRGRYAHLGILVDKMKRAGDEAVARLATHFFGIMAGSTHKPYQEDDFACYDDSFFTPDGVKALGSTLVLNNRAALSRVLLGTPGVTFQGKPTLLREAFEHLYRARNETEENKKRIKMAESEDKTVSDIKSAINECLDTYISHYPVLKKMPLKEIREIINNPTYHSLYPLCIDHTTDLVRCLACKYIYNTPDLSLYFYLEHSNVFLEVFCEELVKSPLINLVAENLAALLIECTTGLAESTEKKVEITDKKGTRNSGDAPESGRKSINREIRDLKNSISPSHRDTVLEQAINNLRTFFGSLGTGLSALQAFEQILTRGDRLLFFRHTATYYLEDPRLAPVFEEALATRDVSVLNCFLKSIHYNCLFVKHILATADITLLSQLIDTSDPSFNILFVKMILRTPGSDASRSLLSKVLCTLHFDPNPEIKDLDLLAQLEKQRGEVRMIVEPEQIQEYEISIPNKIELRGYQKEGIKWIAFLNKFGLNGILADDMGLGKTVQVLCFILNEMYKDGVEEINKEKEIKNFNENEKTFEKNQELTNNQSDEDFMAKNQFFVEKSKLKTLILCPSSLTSHWKDEVSRFFGAVAEIYDLKKGSFTSNILVCSYDSFRRDSSLSSSSWSFVVFDEAHLLKNRSTILFAKAKSLLAPSKLLLTGTPIHNSVDDLFSLFDIAMPGYLGTDDQFSSLYSCRVTDKNVAAMETRLEALHKKTLPFILRRLKSEVLTDLPPKVIKDLLVDMNSNHAALYASITGKSSADALPSGYAALRASLSEKSSTLVVLKDSLKASSHPHHFDTSVYSSKTTALLELFSMCENSKILVFFQLKSTIDFVLAETDLKNVLRLDGSVPPAQRGEIVTRFNTESVQYLFLTTSIGGLGLNLTSADVVIFYEHDWNPFNDLQAMDRAHRLGQKKTVNVFRLICKDTIEERVMNYQSFKLHVASAVVSQQNNEMRKMDTKDLLERFK